MMHTEGTQIHNEIQRQAISTDHWHGVLDVARDVRPLSAPTED